MEKIYTALGFMSGTSGDGIDASIIKSDGKNDYTVLANRFYRYPSSTVSKIHKLKEKIKTSFDLNKFSEEVNYLDDNIAIQHAKAAKDIKKIS